MTQKTGQNYHHTIKIQTQETKMTEHDSQNPCTYMYVSHSIYN